MAKILLHPQNASESGGIMKKRLPNAYIRGNYVYIDIMIDGRQIRMSSGKSATAANLRWVSQNAYEIYKNSLLIEQSRQNIVSVYGLRSLEIGSVSRKASTAKDYLSTFKNYILPYFGNKELGQIKASDVAIWQKRLIDKGLSASRVKNIRATFQTIFADALRDEIITKSPFAGVKTPKGIDPTPKPFSVEEIKLLASNTSDFFGRMILTLAFTGMRTGEAMALTWDDVDFKGKTITISKSISNGTISTTKTGKTRVIDMLPTVEKVLLEQYEATGYKKSNVFLAPKTGRGYRESASLGFYWRPLLKKCGLEKRDFYQLRHSFASIMLSEGEDPLWVSQMMGHETLSTTLKYYARFIKGRGVLRANFLGNYGL